MAKPAEGSDMLNLLARDFDQEELLANIPPVHFQADMIRTDDYNFFISPVAANQGITRNCMSVNV